MVKQLSEHLMLNQAFASPSYYDAPQFASYYRQFDEITRLSPGSVLEVGAGLGLLAWLLNRCGVYTVTFDNDESLNPDYVGDIRHLPQYFPPSSFDVVACFEVLEHLPFYDLSICLGGINKVCRHYAVISLPNALSYLSLRLSAPKLGYRSFGCSLPLPKRPQLYREGGHHYEIGWKGFPLQAIKTQITSSGFVIERQYRNPENPYHHFFILKST